MKNPYIDPFYWKKNSISGESCFVLMISKMFPPNFSMVKIFASNISYTIKKPVWKLILHNLD
jgi:hypothetical protein